MFEKIMKTLIFYEIKLIGLKPAEISFDAETVKRHQFCDGTYVVTVASIVLPALLFSSNNKHRRPRRNHVGNSPFPFSCSI